MMKFVSKSRNPYVTQQENIKKESVKGQFVSKSQAGTIHMFRDNTANIVGKKVEFKHV